MNFKELITRVFVEAKERRPNTVLVTGNTYAYRAQIRALGGEWFPDERAWEIPQANLNQVLALDRGITAMQGQVQPRPAAPVTPPVRPAAPTAPSASSLPKLNFVEMGTAKNGDPMAIVSWRLGDKNPQMLQKIKEAQLWVGGSKQVIKYIETRPTGPVYGILMTKPAEIAELRRIMSQYLDDQVLNHVMAGRTPPRQPDERTSLRRTEPVRSTPMPENRPARQGQPERKLQTMTFEDLGTFDEEDPSMPPDEHGRTIRTLEKMKITYPFVRVAGFLRREERRKLEEAQSLKAQLVQYNFQKTERTRERYRKPDGTVGERVAWTVYGTFDQYSKFGYLLRQHGFDTDQLREIFDRKFGTPVLDSSGRPVFEKDARDSYGRPIKRQVHRYPDAMERDASPEFIESVQQKLPNLNITLYDAQKHGVGFLHGRRRAILGDDTGVGKTVQLIAAAELKMRDTNYEGDTLIITLKDVREQWRKEILGVLGEEADELISFDPLNPKRYTIVYYNMFSPAQEAAKRNTEDYKAALKAHNFKIAIFDELHKVKHKTSLKAQNLLEVVSSIPIKWGATATLSSNKPMDVKNQLRMLGHALGYIDEKKFKADFAAIGGRRKKTPEEKFRDQIRAAENLNKWLHLTGVYIKRTKEDIREDMPLKTVGDTDIQIDIPAYEASLYDKIYGNPAKGIKGLKKIMPLTVLGAVRQRLAVHKVPQTIKRAIELIRQGKRVVIFTSYIDAGFLLKHRLQEEVKAINPNWDILTFTSDTKPKDRKQVRDKFSKEPSADNPYRALVMSIKMGGTGIDFPNAATHMLINDYDWTPESCEQSEGRIYRINTNNPVQVEYMLAQGTEDGEIFGKVKEKRAIAAEVQKYRRIYQDATSGKQKVALDKNGNELQVDPNTGRLSAADAGRAITADQLLDKIVAAQERNRRIDQEIGWADVEDEKDLPPDERKRPSIADSIAARMGIKFGKKSVDEALTFGGYMDYFNNYDVFSEDEESDDTE